MDDDSAADVPTGDAIDAGPASKPAPPTSRAVAMFAIVFVVLALIAAAAWFIGGPSPEPKSCTADGRIDPVTGFTYSRDPNQDCKFVDLDGNVLPGQ
jgi:hypothetical protein